LFSNIKSKLKYGRQAIKIDDEILENIDTNKFGKKKDKHYVICQTKNMYNTFFKDESVTIQAQLLLFLIMSRKLKEATSLLVIQKMKNYRKVKQNVFDNITGVLKSFGKSRKNNVNVARRAIQTTVVSSSNIKYRLIQHMQKMMGMSKWIYSMSFSQGRLLCSSPLRNDTKNISIEHHP
jgi:hypothetical protein